MAAVKVTINGVICDLYGRTLSGPVKIVGEAMYSDLGVGGGPIVPPDTPPGSGGGDHIWGGGNVPMPSPPIANVPGAPGYQPPDKPDEPITPPVEWKAIWAGPEQGWVVVGVPNVPHPTPSA